MWVSSLLVLLVSSATSSSLPFITTWSTLGYAPNITLPTILSAQSPVTIDWGDNSTSTINPQTNSTGLSHTYAVTGTYNVSIFGEFRWISPTNKNIPIKSKLIDIVSWGDGFLIDANSSGNLFGNYNNLYLMSASPNTQPVFLPGARLDEMFYGTPFNSPLNWDLLNVTHVNSMFHTSFLNSLINFSNTQGLVQCIKMFRGAADFNQPFTMDIPNVLSVESMFEGTVVLNQPITLTNSQKLTNATRMFFGCFEFNQPLSLDTRAVIDMRSMFYGASSFNQTLNFSSFATTQLMTFMFQDCTAFEQDLASWDTSSVTQCVFFCPRCGLPAFPQCNGTCGLASPFVNERGMRVCYSPAPTMSHAPTSSPTSSAPTIAPTPSPTGVPSTSAPTSTPTSGAPSTSTPTSQPTSHVPTLTPSTAAPTLAPSSAAPSLAPSAEDTKVSSAEPLMRVGLLAWLVAVTVAVLV